MYAKLVAPCGMNCSLCRAFLREKNKCSGCRGGNEDKMISCLRCSIRSCASLKQKGLKFCSLRCEKYPCPRLKALDKRYKTKYMMSMIENLEKIEKNGIRRFLKAEDKRWVKGNKIFCVHDKEYYVIGK